MSWTKAESSVRPEAVDSTSSKVYVYVNKNITEVTKTDDEGNEYTMYEFDQQKVLKDDWTTYELAIGANDLSEQNEADIAYIAMETGIEL